MKQSNETRLALIASADFKSASEAKGRGEQGIADAYINSGLAALELALKYSKQRLETCA